MAKKRTNRLCSELLSQISSPSVGVRGQKKKRGKKGKEIVPSCCGTTKQLLYNEDRISEEAKEMRINK